MGYHKCVAEEVISLIAVRKHRSIIEMTYDAHPNIKGQTLTYGAHPNPKGQTLTRRGITLIINDLIVKMTFRLRGGLFFPDPYHGFFFCGKKPGVFYFAYQSENNLGYGFN
jgi:hypothetical protein